MRKSLTRLTKSEILRRKPEIQALFAQPGTGNASGASGRSAKSTKTGSVQTEGLKLRFRPNNLGRERVFFSPVKRLGNAVQRNRAKRLFRELYRQHRVSRAAIPAAGSGSSCAGDFCANNSCAGDSCDWAFVILPCKGGGDYQVRQQQYFQVLDKARRARLKYEKKNISP